MKKILLATLVMALAISLAPTLAAQASHGDYHMYLVPIDTHPSAGRGPRYFCYVDGDPDCIPDWSMIDYGFVDVGVVMAKTISAADHAFLLAQADVYAFPDDLDTPVPPNSVDTFFESFNIPTNWMTPATTHRELLHSTLAMFQINQKYGGLSGGQSIFAAYTLDDRPSDMTAQELQWLRDSLNFFEAGLGNALNVNQTFRTNLNNARSVFATWTFYLGGLEF